MEKEKMIYHRERLLEMRRDLIQKLNDRYNDAMGLGGDGSQDSADEAYNLYNKNLMLGRVETDALKLRLVEQALQRIDAGSYGVCIECEEDIEEKRLEYVPFARYCTECKTELEKKGLIKM
ncbi:transcriptional regulator, TraR/DksA family [Denitrovibrio acetiphilus DSM 12809]|uniref:Transcriptional regulator, TraR/DksA family n=1 Tax=Denitrovibrio acetiphilus (strain DSM 12809 / NBRC 114555 / N2460) TaxID=522772 RepID=D4H6J7_DENA2|nr:TraR/DksA C4-type zinc finger protein [Denitrovibrio acetiphilus]ADD69671.1 transcriptional regulator, TraR/DksA family [Denitrovibrio acetiphilus DSM 12809]